MIAVIDYGMGNLYSVSRALERIGCQVRVTSDPEEVCRAEGVILPGVGAFGIGMKELKERGLVDVIKEVTLRKRTPLLGICLGMQLMFTGSEEHGYHQGLNLLAGHVFRLEGNCNIPHLGWNGLRFNGPHPLLRGVGEGSVYFAHSYHVIPANPADVLAVTDYCGSITAIVGRNNLFGMQFHPEKSGETGRLLLERFVALCEERVKVG
ncbi:imidazole glycerol phosphate synthase subunit HisH [Kroppenstedtia guangzhouensis]|uniref:Imidazole glycerol phosphate synthase subunit HisH n=1 Tax=Kroppenstedtia guangzhouensis TaxID=1274356 RepID=A0ABQ1GJC7_9BACL|nr:imidazole glycerol phosphate synthase subunit HisH [Kroppenstedtia guangzhouensis]GGA44951.1 imidazole glycerol phosphate synthase subunit HisH [Kroppenstedtia guangzhouensis]